MSASTRLRLRCLAALSGGLAFSALPLACSSGETAKDDLKPSCSSGSPTVECYAPGSTHFNQGNVINPPPAPEPHFDANNCQVQNEVSTGCCIAATSGPELIDGQCCYGFCSGVCCGRPLLVDGTPRLAPVTTRRDWSDATAVRVAHLSRAERELLAQHWLVDAQLEHASIASFARFCLDLLAFGAPAELIEAAQRALGDEIRHARACFSLASAYAGTTFGPGPLNLSGVAPSTSLAVAAAAAVREGCINETIAALAASQQSESATDPVVADVLAGIARDEAEHAELAWRFVSWAVASGEPAVLAAVRAALCEEPTGTASSEPSLREHGRLTARELSAVAHTAWRDVIAPCAATLG